MSSLVGTRSHEERDGKDIVPILFQDFETCSCTFASITYAKKNIFNQQKSIFHSKGDRRISRIIK